MNAALERKTEEDFVASNSAGAHERQFAAAAGFDSYETHIGREAGSLCSNGRHELFAVRLAPSNNRS
ncbi:MAG TPA: hypothetical protein VHR97_02265, partial [Candidatus Baltobacteraceae bacterium]|nr:hypothetical protein [Candidatus Baltobacteraceae bacterium]